MDGGEDEVHEVNRLGCDEEEEGDDDPLNDSRMKVPRGMLSCDDSGLPTEDMEGKVRCTSPRREAMRARGAEAMRKQARRMQERAATKQGMGPLCTGTIVQMHVHRVDRSRCVSSLVCFDTR